MVTQKEKNIHNGGYSFVAPFILVYGTLRKSQTRSDIVSTYGSYIQTRRLKGWKLYKKDKVNFPFAVFSGNMEDSIVVDVVKITPNSVLNTYEANYLLDSIEGELYNPVLLEIELYNGKVDYAKIYHSIIDQSEFILIPSGNFTNVDSTDYLRNKIIL